MGLRIEDVNLPDIIGGGYGEFWRYNGAYRIVKGSRGSKKSRTAALWYIYNMMRYSGSNLLVVRKVFRTIKESCFTELIWAINRLGVRGAWTIKESPLEMTFKRTGQKIYFRGLDDPQKITSMTVETGTLCWMWIEEAYEIMNESDFDMLDESIRGVSDVFKQITMTFNPWNEKHWIKRRFFDVQDPDILAITTTYLCNEWLDDADARKFERMKAMNPRRYNVAGLGNWGIVEGVIFENWEEAEFDADDIRRNYSVRPVYGLDFGYTNDPTAIFCGLIDRGAKRLYVYDEVYQKGMSNEAIANKIAALGLIGERITADSSEPKSIDRLRELGVAGIRGARKGRDSVRNGIDYLQGYEILIHKTCVNFLTEIGNYTWDIDKSGHRLNIPIDDFNHLMDAMRYACEDLIRGGAVGFD